MPKEEWGVKRVCPTTGKRFYDLNKSPIVSPYTNEVVELDQNKNRMIAADAADMSTVRDKEAELESEDIVLEEDADDVEVNLTDDILEDDEEDTVPLEEIADMSSDDDS
ncbi:TIGR02300 family protein [Rhodobacteraceae bacterium]|nr:TIGR02300 family protein [Paracoccaceae bacterium]